MGEVPEKEKRVTRRWRDAEIILSQWGGLTFLIERKFNLGRGQARLPD
jgi:hypothetical protein